MDDIAMIMNQGRSWNHMIFAHLNGQISTSNETCPYCFMGEETTAVKFSEKTNILLLLTPLLPKIRLTDGQIPSDFLTCP